MKVQKFGIIGCGLMGREFASAASRWCHLLNMQARPEIVAVCDTLPAATQWFSDHLPSVRYTSSRYTDLLEDPDIDAIYCAVPHHLHENMYIDIIRAGKHLLGEKPFGIDLKANQAIIETCRQHPEVLVRCSSEFPFFPGGYEVFQKVRNGFTGKIIEVEAGFWHSSDLNPLKPINWKRQIEQNGEYGCMGDLGMHILHLPLRLGWIPSTVHAVLSNLVKERPGSNNEMLPCETWDNALLSCEVSSPEHSFPMILSTKRIAPGHSNSWFIRIHGMKGSIEYSTAQPKLLRTLDYEAGGDQAWMHMDLPWKSAYPGITGAIFEFGFPDAMLQMWAAFCDELLNREQMHQPLSCVTPEETRLSHKIFSAALESYRTRQTIRLDAAP